MALINYLMSLKKDLKSRKKGMRVAINGLAQMEHLHLVMEAKTLRVLELAEKVVKKLL